MHLPLCRRGMKRRRKSDTTNNQLGNTKHMRAQIHERYQSNKLKTLQKEKCRKRHPYEVLMDKSTSHL